MALLPILRYPDPRLHTRAAPVREVLAFDHPFIRHFFLGERGQRAMELLRTRHGEQGQ